MCEINLCWYMITFYNFVLFLHVLVLIYVQQQLRSHYINFIMLAKKKHKLIFSVLKEKKIEILRKGEVIDSLGIKQYLCLIFA